MKTKINVSPGFILFWTAIYFFDTENIFISLAVSAAVHEFFHLIMLRFVGGDVEAINFRLTGLEIVCRGELLSYTREFLSAAAGPLGSYILAICAAKLGAYTMSGVSMTLFVFNILPVQLLDGGKMLYSAMAMLFDDEKAEKTVFVTSMAVTCSLGVAGLWFRQPSFVYFAVILGFCCCKIEKNGVKFKYNRI